MTSLFSSRAVKDTTPPECGTVYLNQPLQWLTDIGGGMTTVSVSVTCVDTVRETCSPLGQRRCTTMLHYHLLRVVSVRAYSLPTAVLLGVCMDVCVRVCLPCTCAANTHREVCAAGWPARRRQRRRGVDRVHRAPQRRPRACVHYLSRSVVFGTPRSKRRTVRALSLALHLDASP